MQNFASALRKVPGMELIDEEALDADEEDKNPIMFLVVPDARALKEMLSLWQRWQSGAPMDAGYTAWRDVFNTLRELRVWGPQDRVHAADREYIQQQLAEANGAKIRLEVELVFRADDVIASKLQSDFVAALNRKDGTVVTQSRIKAIGYHALLVEVDRTEADGILALSPASIAGYDLVMHIRPQSVASKLVTSDIEPARSDNSVANGSPILALIDGVPVAQHSLLAGALIVDDQFDLESSALLADRIHGTAMASLIVHGDRNRLETSLPRKIHVVPVLGKHEEFPVDQLIVDMLYQAVHRLRGGVDPTAPGVLIVNLSLGNSRRVFHGQMSAWARLLDRLAYQFGILFIVSAGNHVRSFEVQRYSKHSDFEDANCEEKSRATISSIGALMAERRLLSPAEAINGLTIGAANIDAVSANDRRNARNIDPYSNLVICNPSSALGPGFANSVKPDLLMPGSREHLSFVAGGQRLSVKPANATRFHGLKVAAPPASAGRENSEHFTGGSSAAAALASRTCHRIHDALESAYGDSFLNLAHIDRATLLKALIVHTASWPEATASQIKHVLGPDNNRQHVAQKNNIRRFLGYGVGEPELAIACAGDRATFWATGYLPPNKAVTVHVPIPSCVNARAIPHSLHATLAWFAPVAPGRQR